MKGVLLVLLAIQSLLQASLVAQTVKNLPAMQERGTQVLSLGQESEDLFCLYKVSLCQFRLFKISIRGVLEILDSYVCMRFFFFRFSLRTVFIYLQQ